MLLPHRDWLCREPDGTLRSSGPGPCAFLSGSFNPFHEGHRALAEVAERKIGAAVAFELSIANVDKPELAPDEVRRRLDQFVGLAAVYVTRATTFEQKAELFPRTVMIVGLDTAVRILDPRYYGNRPDQRDRSLHRIREHGCRFLVGGRIDSLGQYRHLDEIEIPTAFRDLFEGLSEAEFRVDLSSTMLRQM